MTDVSFAGGISWYWVPAVVVVRFDGGMVFKKILLN